MDRTIKFRAWSTENKKMYPVDEFTCNWKRNFVVKTSELVIKSTDILMQFTGLYDCEGKEVFEGDILEYKEYYANIKWWSSVEEIPIIAKRTEQQRQDFRVERNVVRFDNGSFCLGYTSLNKYYCCNNVLVEKLESGRQFHGDYERKQWDFKVIGNIYEHPQLLNNER